ncbi:hypothetical protein ACQ4XT_02750 [Halobacillus faecis]
MNEYQSFFASFRKYIKKLDSSYMDQPSEDPDNFLDEMSKSNSPTPKKEAPYTPLAVEEFKEMISILDKTEFIEDVIPYSEITSIIFHDTQPELLGALEKYLELNWEDYNKKLPPDVRLKTSLKRKFLKIKEHVGLSTVQRNHVNLRLSAKLDKVNKDMSDLEKKMKGYKDLLADTEDRVQKKYDDIITQFIAILGIFAAILMGAFGSIQGFTSMFNNAASLPVGKMLVASSIGGSAVVLILFLLFNAVSKLTGKRLSSCNCHMRRKKKGILQQGFSALFGGEESEDEVCKCSLFDKHPSVVIIHYLLYFISITGFVLIYLDESSLFASVFTSPISIPATVLVTYIISTLSLLLLHIGFVTKKKGQVWYEKIWNHLRTALGKIRKNQSVKKNPQ